MLYQGLSLGMTLALVAGGTAALYTARSAWRSRHKVSSLLAEYRQCRK